MTHVKLDQLDLQVNTTDTQIAIFVLFVVCLVLRLQISTGISLFSYFLLAFVSGINLSIYKKKALEGNDEHGLGAEKRL